LSPLVTVVLFFNLDLREENKHRGSLCRSSIDLEFKKHARKFFFFLIDGEVSVSTIARVPNAETHISFALLQDPRLTFATKMLMCWLMRLTRAKSADNMKPTYYSCKRLAKSLRVSVPTISAGIDQLETVGYFIIDRETREYTPIFSKSEWIRKLHGDRSGSLFFKINEEWLDSLSLSEAAVLGLIIQMRSCGKNRQWVQNNRVLEELLGLSEATIVRKVNKLKNAGWLQCSGMQDRCCVYEVAKPSEECETVRGGEVVKLRAYR
jgi:biotin operon repressor